MSRKTKALRKHRKLGMETLETRRLMAGNVTASLDTSGTLHILGDAAANGLAIYQVNDTTLRVAGLSQGGSNTTINGTTSVRDFRNVQRLNVDLGAGDDRIEIGLAATTSRFTNIPKGATIHAGSGNDVITIQRTATHENINIHGGTGNDAINVRQVQVGSPHDEFRRGSLSIQAGSGSDIVGISDTTVNQSITVDPGLGFFSDQVFFTNVTAGRNVTLSSNDPDATRVDTKLRTEFNGVKAGGEVFVDARRAQSDVSLVNVTSDAVFIELGAKDDLLRLESISSRRTEANGGDGHDALTTLLAGPVNHTGFEQVFRLMPSLDFFKKRS